MSQRFILLLALACLFSSLPVGVSSAQFVVVEPPARPSAAEVARARESFKNGLSLADAGRWPEAVLAFDEAYRRSGNPVALLNLAAALRESGRLADARTCLIELRVRHIDQLDLETQKRGDELYRSVTAVVELHAVPAAAVTAVDGQIVEAREQNQAQQEQRFELDPGLHHFRVSAPGQVPFEWRGVIAPGEVHHLTYQAHRSPEPVSSVSAAARPQAAPHEDELKTSPAPARRRLPRWAIGLLVSAATLAVGAAVAVPLVLRDRGMDAPGGVDATYELP